jgi:D-alanyl-D-alanine carboxypeptidase/D-alanyl-D-alanine-endopeptidase (penicillin-binding protein 4)
METRIYFSAKVMITMLTGLCLILLSCTASKKSTTGVVSLKSILTESPVFNNHFTGFVLFDPETQKTLFDQNSDKYFTPASNTKILTLYASLMSLPDTLPSVKIAEIGDHIIIKGMGDPTLFHELWPNHPLVKLLSNTPKKILLVKDAFGDEVQGAGWAWDDYQDDYQAEKSAFPLYGNVVKFTPLTTPASFIAYPSYFNAAWTFDGNKNNSHLINRDILYNVFSIHDTFKGPHYIPFKSDMNVIKNLLQDTLKKDVGLILTTALPHDLTWHILQGVPSDSVYAQMMKVSDNFIAEQLLLLTDAYIKDSSNTAQCIQYLQQALFHGTPDPIQWHDGSGLSRYNLITPRTLIYVLNQIKSKLSMEGIKKIFPMGGVGTLSNWYKGPVPYIYAKTGSLMNNHSLSGFIHTSKGHDLIFSFMHSNYTGSVNPIRMEMQKTLEFIRDHY